MTGAELKKKLDKLNVNYAEMAKELGFTDRQALYSKLKTKDVTISLLLQIAKYVNKSVYHFLPAALKYDDPHSLGEPAETYGARAKIEELERTIANLNKYIASLQQNEPEPPRHAQYSPAKPAKSTTNN